MKIRNTNRLNEENKLSNKFPELAAEWNIEKNGQLTPDMVSYGSNMKVWWKCNAPEQHEWEQTICDRSREGFPKGCAVCNKPNRKGVSKRIKPGNALAERCPESLEYWDYEKNNGKTPYDFSFSTTDEVWWKCSNGHHFKKKIADFRIRLHKCKDCVEAGLVKVRAANAMSNYNFNFISEYDTERNKETIEEVSIKSKKNYWWKCSEGHPWQDSPKNRLSGYGCGVCNARKNYTLEELTTLVRMMWNDEKNPKSANGQYHKNQKVWWICPEGHEWREDYSKMTRTNFMCCECAGILPEEKHLLINALPELVSQYDCEKNKLDVKEVSVYSREKLVWICSHKHNEEKTIEQKLNLPKCDKCAGVKLRKVAPTETIASVYPERAKMWHPILNGILEPTDFSFGTKRMFWWLCENGHSYYGPVIISVSAGNKKVKRCEKCKVDPGRNSLQETYPQLMQYWDYEKNKMKPEQVFADSKRMYRWKCEKGHTWRQYIDKQKETGCCSICKGEVYVKPNEGESLGEKHPEILGEWDYEKNGELTPYDLTAGTLINVWWKCAEGHSFNMPVSKYVVRLNKCTVCKGKEKNLLREKWDSEKNGSSFDEKLTKSSRKKAWYKCGKGHSEWISPLQIYGKKACKKCKEERKNG